MAEWYVLIAVASILYVAECLTWVSISDCAAFRHPSAASWRPSTETGLLGNVRGGFVLASPFSFGGGIVVLRSSPLCISPEGVSKATLDEPETCAPYVPFEDIRSVTADLGTVRINGRRFADVRSSTYAVHIAREINRVRAAPRAQRALAIENVTARMANQEAVAGTWTEFRQRTAMLRTLCAGLFGYVFIVSQVILYGAGPYPAWVLLLIGLMLLNLAVVVVYFRAHRDLYSFARYDRWAHALTLALFPIGSIRCVDRLSRDALCAYSPFAVLPYLCGTEAAAPLLRRRWFDLDTTSENPQHDGVAWFQGVMRSGMAAALRSCSIDIMSPPPREDEAAERYCPRCHGQFRNGRTECSDCIGVELMTFGDERCPRHGSKQREQP